MGVVLAYASLLFATVIIASILILMTIFSFSGAFSGIIIHNFGYTVIFIFTNVLILSSFYFSRKVSCKRFESNKEN